MAPELIPATYLPPHPSLLSALAETTALLNLNVRAIVDDRDQVAVAPVIKESGNVVFCVTVGPRDLGKLIGKQGRTARSLRILLSAIAKQQGASYSLDLDGRFFGEHGDGNAD